MLSGRHEPAASLLSGWGRSMFQYAKAKGRAYAPFPDGTKGFLYWHLPPAAPVFTGEIRFRITASSDPTTFSRGEDLRLPNQKIWKIPLSQIIHRKTRRKYEVFQRALLEEGLVTQKTVDIGPAIVKGLKNAKGHTIWRFGQSFEVIPQKAVTKFMVPTSSSIERMKLRHLFHPERMKVAPFTGRILVQFERSTLPEHAGTRSVVLRIVQILQYAKSKNQDIGVAVPEPKEGDLVMKLRRGSEGQEEWIPWSVDVDKKYPVETAKALRVLFESEEHIKQTEKADENH
ncbi:hypothetical protein OE88DRAFT_601140 [Heliocybe sulcata]|uniref:Uncharacterized protein n=1 Tax=Heliocybe sulcata TaxID=5364 RepID=A0A5C3MTD8_9AGAM|nr:hypothetical protein OE88DRAFT_601140 [Heliocybe sulcata]